MTPSGNLSAERSVDQNGEAGLIEENESGSCCSLAGGESNSPLQSFSSLRRESSPALAEMIIDFLEVEMPSTGGSRCSACDSVHGQLEATIAFAEPLFAELGVQFSVRATQVRTEEEVRRLGVWGSPTIRIGEVSLYPEHRGMGEERVWAWRGKVYESPPRALLLHSLLHGYLTWARSSHMSDPVGQAFNEEVGIPSYLRQFLTPEGTQ